MNILTGLLEEMAPTRNGFGEQYSKIGGVTYVTYETLGHGKLKGLSIGATIEFEVCEGPIVLCNKPHVTTPLPRAKFLRVVKARGEQ